MIPIDHRQQYQYPRVTVLMLSYIRPARLLATLVNLKRTYSNIDLVLHITGADECTELDNHIESIKDALHGFSSYKLKIVGETESIGKSRNSLIEQAVVAENEYVFFIDDNMEVKHGAFEIALDLLSISGIPGVAVQHTGGRCSPMVVKDGNRKECWSTLPIEAYAVVPLDFSAFKLSALKEVVFNEDTEWWNEIEFCLDMRRFGPLYIIRPEEPLVHCDKSGNTLAYNEELKRRRESQRLKLLDEILINRGELCRY